LNAAKKLMRIAETEQLHRANVAEITELRCQF
jgi:hypothetical protein